MSIDDMVVRDPRITKLSTLVGWSRRETVGCLILDVWPICYDQRESVIVADLIDIAAGLVGFADAMVRSGLAERLRGNRKIRIKGAQERIEYLDHKKAAGRVGGLKSAESRSQSSSTRGSTPQARGNPSVPDSASAPDKPTAPVPEEKGAALPPLVNLDIKKKGRTRKPREQKADSGASGDHARVRACWLAYWKRKTGMAPEWGGKHGKRLNEILAAHGASEVERRIALLEASGVRFHQGWDFMQFASMSDQLVAAAASDGYDVRYGRARLPSPEEYEQGDDPFGERKPVVVP
jgi:hypothetical protein